MAAETAVGQVPGLAARSAAELGSGDGCRLGDPSAGRDSHGACVGLGGRDDCRASVGLGTGVGCGVSIRIHSGNNHRMAMG